MAWAFVVLVVVIALVGYFLLRKLDEKGPHERHADERATTVLYDEETGEGAEEPNAQEEQRP